MTDSNATLLQCPFCGGEDLEIDHAPTYDVHHPDVYEAHCVECGCRGGEGWTEAEAIAAWNTRAERTCKVAASYSPSDMNEQAEWYFAFTCGCELYWDESEPPNYCPNCGARVLRNTPKYSETDAKEVGE